MTFIPPMLATRLEDPRRLADPRYSAEPKLDGQRAQIHVRDHRTIHAFSRPGREMIRLPGLAWLRDIRWPIASAILDGEGGRRRRERGYPGGVRGAPPVGEPDAFAAFDLLVLMASASWASPGRRDGNGSRICSRRGRLRLIATLHDPRRHP